MTHGMEESDQMFSVRLAPWHMSMGTNVTVLPDHPAPEDVLVQAGLNWDVKEGDLFTAPGERLEGHRRLYRSDNDDTLSVMRDSYHVIQNTVGAEVMEALLDGADNTKYETGGSIQGGRSCYLTARIDEPLSIPGDPSPTLPYFVVMWGHDGMSALTARATTVRVVCQNTISAAEAESERSGRRWRFTHSANFRDRINEAKDALAGVNEESKRFQVLANELLALPITKEQREVFVQEFIPAPVADVVSDRVRNNIETARDEVRALFNGPTISENLTATAYGLLLAGTEYLDHIRGARSSDTYLGRTLLREESLKAKLVPMIREVAAATL